MRKTIPSILIVLILVNLFAPFTIGIKNGIPVLKKSVASADLSITILKKKRTNTSISFAFDITQLSNTDHEGLVVIVTDKPGTTISKENLQLIDISVALDKGCNIDDKVFSYPVGSRIDGGRDGCTSNWIDFKKNGVVEKTINGLTPNTKYYVSYFGYAGDTSGESLAYPRYDVEISTTGVGEVDDEEEEELATINSDAGYLPWCTKAVFRVNIGGCFAQILYTILFKPTSFLFELTGKFFDFSFFYSVGDKAYTNTFVTGGWGIVRDFVNIFFIFVLLWIAFSTILNLHGFKTKEMIINVVIIGLLMNFSLFATRVIIDTSNILARVFYSATTVTTSDKTNPENKTETLGKSGEKQLSIAVVKAVDPQKLIIKAARVGSTDPNRNSSSPLRDDFSKGVSVGTFILVTLLASIVNIVGMFVFLSVGLLMIGRVIGLWIAMILVPIAFFSYMVPAMKNIEAIGWSKWWDNTLKLSFLAPIFMFFMYLILKFVDGDFLPKLNGNGGTDFVLGIIVPFAFIMILMMKAKKLAAQFAGDIGSMVTKAAVIGGGAALAGGAMGAAFLGRNIVGAGVATMSRGKDAVHYGQQKVAFNKKLEEWEKKGGKKSGIAKPTWEDHKKQNNVKDNLFTRIGGNLNAKQKKVSDIDHARHDVDEIKKKAGLEGVDNRNLSGADKQKLKETYVKEKKSEIESDIRSGKSPMTDASGNPVKDSNGNIITGGESGFKSAKRDEISHQMGMDPNNVDHGTGELTDAAKKKVEDELNVQFNAVLETSRVNAGGKKFDDLEKKSNQKVGGFERAFANSNKSSYDPRNVSDIKSDRREGILTKIPVALMAGIAVAVRSGLKDGIGIDHGKGQGDLLKDLGKTISNAISHMSKKVGSSVEKALDDGHKGGNDHGGGDHH